MAPAPDRSFHFMFRTDIGRIDRASWWRGTLPLTGIALAMTAVWLMLRPYASHDLSNSPFLAPSTILAFLYLAVFTFALILIAVCEYNLSAKRFRDRGRAGALAAVLPLSIFGAGALIWFIPRSFGELPSGPQPWRSWPSWPSWAGTSGILALARASDLDHEAEMPARVFGGHHAPWSWHRVSPPSALDIARALIRCPSVTPEDGGAIDLLAKLLAEAGFAVDLPVFTEPGQPAIRNLYARLGDTAPYLVFAGHTDVVPPGEEAHWRFSPFSAEVADGMLWGRGACDMKGGVAAAVAAVLAQIARHGAPAGSIGFLITGDEEGPAVNGTVKLLEWASRRGERFDHCLLGEPTNPRRLGEMMKIGRRGSLTGQITVRGRQGHVAYPHLADNPIPRLLRLASALLAEPLDRGTEHFDPSNLEFVSLDVGNPSNNVIPAEARARFNIRFNDLWTPETLRAEIARRLGDPTAKGASSRLSSSEGKADPLDARVAAGTLHDAGECDLTFQPCNALAFLTAPGPFTALVAEAVEQRTGLRPVLSTTGGTSDARFITAYCPVVEFGLVGLTMHAVDERVGLDDLAMLQSVYEYVIEHYFVVPALA